MLYIIRLITVVIFFLLFSASVLPLLLFRPFHANNTHSVLQLFKPAHWIINLKIHCLKPQPAEQPVIYIGNHQSLLDIFLYGPIWPKNSAVIGKQSIIFIPFFGIVYWLCGNVFINRKEKSKAWALVDQVVDSINNKQLSFLFMPEGTRSKGQGLLPFKKGAFAAAIKAGVPIVPICTSSVASIDVHRWRPKAAFVTYMEPIPTTGMDANDVAKLAQHCHALMSDEIERLNALVASNQRADKNPKR